MRFLSQHLSTLSGPLNLHASEHRGRAGRGIVTALASEPGWRLPLLLPPSHHFIAIPKSSIISLKTRVDFPQKSLQPLKLTPKSFVFARVVPPVTFKNMSL